MRKRLYFVCPTDYLEAVIDNKFQEESYFLTSLGNSITFDETLIKEINALIAKRHITEITFILSRDNQMIRDAIEHQDFMNVRGLRKFYDEIKKQKRFTALRWHGTDLKTSIISYYLNLKIKELQLQLNNCFVGGLKINAMVYNSKEKDFSEINTALFHQECFSLN